MADQQDFLDLFHRILPEEYVTPLFEPGPGGEVLQMAAKVMERLSTAVDRLEEGSLILTAPSGSLATVSVTFTRQSFAAGAVTLQAGTILTTSQGREFATTEDAVFGPTDLSVTVGARAVAPAYEYNVPGPVTTADGTVLPGEIDSSIPHAGIRRPLQVDPSDPDEHFVDPTIAVEQVADATGGSTDTLSALGNDRGLPRFPGEDDASYRQRIRQLPDTVSIDAIRRAVDAAFAPFGGGATVIETYDVTFQTFWDMPDNNVFVYDDPRDSPPFRDRWLDQRFMSAAFLVVVPNLPPIADVSCVYDDPATAVAEYTTTFGRRAVCAYDLPRGLGGGLLECAYDGIDLPRRSIYGGLWASLQRIKAAGVAVAIELETGS